jgi:hypothetical protein
MWSGRAFVSTQGDCLDCDAPKGVNHVSPSQIVTGASFRFKRVSHGLLRLFL